MTDAPPARALEREQQARTLRVASELEPRPSRIDEGALTERARLREAQELRDQLLDAFATIERRLAFIEAKLGRVAPGDHHERARHAQRAIRALRSPLE